MWDEENHQHAIRSDETHDWTNLPPSFQKNPSGLSVATTTFSWENTLVSVEASSKNVRSTLLSSLDIPSGQVVAFSHSPFASSGVCDLAGSVQLLRSAQTSNAESARGTEHTAMAEEQRTTRSGFTPQGTDQAHIHGLFRVTAWYRLSFRRIPPEF